MSETPEGNETGLKCPNCDEEELYEDESRVEQLVLFCMNCGYTEER